MTSQHSRPTSFTFIQEHGYAVLPHVFSKPEISALTWRSSFPNHNRSEAAPALGTSFPLVRYGKLQTAGESSSSHFAVLGSRALPFRAKLFDKSPWSNWLVAWHQDTALPLTEKVETPGWGPCSIKDGVNCTHAPREALEQILALRIHLDDSTSANGPLGVIPNTHRDGVLTDCEVQERRRNQ